MEENLRLCLLTQSFKFQEWLRQFSPDRDAYIKYLEVNGDTAVYITYPDPNGLQDDYSKILGTPKETVSSQGDTQYLVEIYQGSLEEITKGKGIKKRIPFLKIVRITSDTTEILIDMNQQDIHVSIYLKELLRQIAETYPETRRTILLINPLITLEMDKKIFEYWLKVDPELFINWSYELLNESYPGLIYIDSPMEERVLQTRLIVLPKDDEVKYWEIIIEVSEIIYPKDQTSYKPYALDHWVIASIRATPIKNNEIHVKCFCEIDNDQVIDWLTNLKTEIENSPFKIRTESSTTEDNAEEDSPKQSEPKKNKKMRAKGPSIDTQQKFLIFKEYKDKNPSFTQSEVAEAVNKEFGTDYSAGNVSYSYKVCGYDWKRGEKK